MTTLQQNFTFKLSGTDSQKKSSSAETTMEERMKLPGNYLKTLPGVLIALLTVVLVALFVYQAKNMQSSSKVSGATVAKANTKKAPQQSTGKSKSGNQPVAQLKKKLGSLEAQLKNSKASEQLAIERLALEEQRSSQLVQEMNVEKARIAEQQTMQASNNTQVQSLGQNLEQRKQTIVALKATNEQNKMDLFKLENELKKKKSELVKIKRELAKSKQELAAKSRQLTISKGQINDLKRN